MRRLLSLLLLLPLCAVADPVLRAGLWAHETDDSPPMHFATPAQWQAHQERMRAEGIRVTPEGRVTHMCFPRQRADAGDAKTLQVLGPGARITHSDVSETSLRTVTEWPGGRMESRFRWLQPGCEELAVMGGGSIEPPAETPAAQRAATPAAATQAEADAGSFTKWMLLRTEITGLQYRLALVRQEGSVGHLQIQFRVDENAHCKDPHCDGYALVMKYPDENNKTRAIHLRFGPSFRGPYTHPELLMTQLKTWPDGSARGFDAKEGVTLALGGAAPRPARPNEFLLACLDEALAQRPLQRCASQFKPDLAVTVR